MKHAFLFLLSASLFLSWLHLQDLPEKRIVLPVSQYGAGADTTSGAGSDATWEEMDVRADRRTNYTLVPGENGDMVIRGVSRAAASGLIYPVNIDIEDHPVIQWAWKIDSVIPQGDLRSKKGDDYAARIYITFEFDRSRLGLGERIKLWAIETFTSYEIPLRAINYIWANHAEVDTIAPNPYTKWVQMIAVRSGNAEAGRWMSEQRNLREDYRQAFGEEPGNITGVAIMTDTDNTGGSATAWYHDIIFP